MTKKQLTVNIFRSYIADQYFAHQRIEHSENKSDVVFGKLEFDHATAQYNAIWFVLEKVFGMTYSEIDAIAKTEWEQLKFTNGKCAIKRD